MTLNKFSDFYTCGAISKWILNWNCKFALKSYGLKAFLQSNMQGMKINVVWYNITQTVYQILNLFTVKVIKYLALIQNVRPLNKIFTRGKWLPLSSNGELKIHNKHTSSLCETQLWKIIPGVRLWTRRGTRLRTRRQILINWIDTQFVCLW